MAARRDRTGGRRKARGLRRAGHLDRDSNTGDLGLLSYLLESGSDRIGALDFQTSAFTYVPRLGSASLEELQTAADKLLAGEELSPDLGMALLRGTSIGGAARRCSLATAAASSSPSCPRRPTPTRS